MVIIAAISLNFFLPRLTGQDPVQQRIAQLEIETGGGGGGDKTDLINNYNEKFGLTKSLSEQFMSYLNDALSLDFGYSISLYPAKVQQI